MRKQHLQRLKHSEVARVSEAQCMREGQCAMRSDRWRRRVAHRTLQVMRRTLAFTLSRVRSYWKVLSRGVT